MRAASVPSMAADLQAQEAKVFNNQKRSCAFPFYVESQSNFPPNVGDVRLKAALQEKDPDSLSTFEPGPCFVACVNEGDAVSLRSLETRCHRHAFTGNLL
jgi:hypothetical protein